MIPVRLLNGDRELVGLYLEPTGQAPARQHAVLLCNPFGQEGIRAHRLYRVMSDRMAAAGYHVLRFDYYGSGDSAGDDEEWDLHGSVADAQAALSELLRRSHAPVRSAVGLRLGATIALEVGRRATLPPQLLMLIEPVLDGRDYLRSLAASSLEALNRGYGARWPTSARLRATLLPAPETEALGFFVSPQARAQIEAIEPSCLDAARATAIRLLTPDSAQTQQLLDRARLSLPRLDLVDTETRIDWATDSAAATAIVPMHWIRDLIDHLELAEHA